MDDQEREARVEHLLENLAVIQPFMIEHDLGFWAQWMADAQRQVLDHDARGFEHIVRAAGGMGSLNDVHLDDRVANDQFWSIWDAIYEDAKALLDVAPEPVIPAPLATFPSWVYDPYVYPRARGFNTATMAIYHGLVVVQPKDLPGWLGRVRGASYSAPAIVVQRLVWSHRIAFPGIAAILLDYDGVLGSAWAPFGMRHDLAPLLRDAGFEVTENTQRGWQAPRPLRTTEYPELVGRVPDAVLPS